MLNFQPERKNGKGVCSVFSWFPAMLKATAGDHCRANGTLNTLCKADVGLVHARRQYGGLTKQASNDW